MMGLVPYKMVKRAEPSFTLPFEDRTRRWLSASQEENPH